MKTMIRLIALIMTTLIPIAGSTDTMGPTLEHSGVLTDVDGKVVPDGTYTLTFSLWNTPQDGDLIWKEQHDAVAVSNGRFEAELGLFNPLSDEAFGLWLETAIEGYPPMPRVLRASAGDATISGVLTTEALMLSSNEGQTGLATFLGNSLFIMNTGPGDIFFMPFAVDDLSKTFRVEHAGGVVVNTGTDAAISDPESGYLTIGDDYGTNLVFDNNEIMARNGYSNAPLYLQHEGGDVRVGGTVVHSSDRRSKTDVQSLAYGLEEVLKLKPVSYRWKKNPDRGRALGLIGQDVQEIVKEIVQEDDEGYLGISYTDLIPLLIKAIQEQQAEIHMQREQIQEIRRELAGFRQTRNLVSRRVAP